MSPQAQISRGLTWLMEVVLLLLVCLSPWAFGAVHAYFELYLYAGVGVLLTLWAGRILVDGRLRWQHCPVAICLAALFLTGLFQVTPLPPQLLHWLSPGSTALYGQMLPAEAELLPGDSGHPQSTLPVGRTLSLHPGASRVNALRLLAVFLIFAVVRNNLVGVEPLRRLSWAAVVNGSLLALFAVVQFFSSRHDSLYWSWRSDSQVYGPFLCRNHFPFYLNLCVGLGLGLLLTAVPVWRGPSRPQTGRSPMIEWLQHPRVLWLSVALALMVSSEVFSLSRGGVVALLGAGAVCLLVRRGAGGGRASVEIGLLIGLLVVGLLAWFGLDAVQNRLSTLWTGKALQEGRLSKWQSVWPLVGAFPMTGTGLGTFAVVEPLCRAPGEDPAELWEHAHNDYVEALVEGGWPRLGLSLAAIGLVGWLGYRAYARLRGRPEAGLVLGALFAFSSVVIHSGLDFGLHVPAIALLAAVIAAHLAGLGQDNEPPATQAAAPVRWRERTLALAGAAAVMLPGLLLIREGVRAERAERLRLAAARIAPADDSERRLAYLAAAVARTPEDAALQLELAEEYHALWQRGAAADAQALPNGLALALFQEPGVGVWNAIFAVREMQSQRRYLAEALRHWVLARDLCPLLAEPQLRLATYGGRLTRADDRLAYLNRATRARPFDPEIWYTAGGGQLAAGNRDQAWASWRRSLECGDVFLAEILQQSSQFLQPSELVAKILPDQPRLLQTAATKLDPDGTRGAATRPLLEKAAALLQAMPQPMRLDDLHLRAQVHRSLGNGNAAETDYLAALRLAPNQWRWRFEYAELLRQQGRLTEARGELRTVLFQQPDFAPAREALRQLTQELPGG